MSRYLLAIDEGTTSCRSILYNESAEALKSSQLEFTQYFPEPSWVEHDANEIWEKQLQTIRASITESCIDAAQIAAIGITNQRETTVVWDKTTGEPICRAIVWQCRRTAPICEELKQIDGFSDYIHENTGLLIDAYFSGTKIKWILDHISGARELAEADRLLFGTIDSWLIYKLSGGRTHVTDYSNASRTMLYNIKTLEWDPYACKTLDIPMSMLPKVVASSGVCAYTDESLFGVRIPIAGIAGDQQAALFGQGCFEPGEAKNTYGTGCFLLMNTGEKRVRSSNGLITTIAWGIDGRVEYALEGSVFIGGAIVQWMRDQLGIISHSAESYEYAVSVANSAGVYVVPAFSGLGAPYWDMYAQGIICGLTRGASKAHIVRAGLESIAYQSMELLDAIEEDSGIHLKELMVDGGACRNDFLMQFQSDILMHPVNRPVNTESTALGAAMLAGLGVGVFSGKDHLKSIRKTDRVFIPNGNQTKRTERIEGWKHAVKMCMSHK